MIKCFSYQFPPSKVTQNTVSLNSFSATICIIFNTSIATTLLLQIHDSLITGHLNQNFKVNVCNASFQGFNFEDDKENFEKCQIYLFDYLNQASAGHRPMCAWFLKVISSTNIGVCVCVCPPPRALITSHMKGVHNNQIRQFYKLSNSLYDFCRQ